jgi:branched-chain amino acid transport system substrate-binding protein
MAQAGTLLPYNDIVLPQVRVLGPALWARDATRLSAFTDAWYAAPDPSQRAAFEQRYNARFHQPPRDFASLAYDAAGIARSASGPGGVDPAALLRPEGFSGADGLIALLPDGRVRRGLAIFEIDRGGSHIVQPSPTTLAAPGS